MPTHSPPLPVWRDRLQLQDVILTVTPSGSSEVTVRLRAPDGTLTSGQGAGLGHREGTMRAAVDAAMRALEPLCLGRLRLEFRGVRSFRAFDARLVVVSILAYPEPGSGAGPDARGTSEPFRLIGSVAAPREDLVRGTVMAVLDAMNRVMEGFMPGLGPESPCSDPEAPHPPAESGPPDAEPSAP